MTPRKWEVLNAVLSSHLEVAESSLKSIPKSNKCYKNLKKHINDLTEICIDLCGDDEEE